jgi:hypothetical protein
VRVNTSTKKANKGRLRIERTLTSYLPYTALRCDGYNPTPARGAGTRADRQRIPQSTLDIMCLLVEGVHPSISQLTYEETANWSR